jgi:hypothetical protein
MPDIGSLKGSPSFAAPQTKGRWAELWEWIAESVRGKLRFGELLFWNGRFDVVQLRRLDGETSMFERMQTSPRRFRSGTAIPSTGSLNRKLRFVCWTKN